MTATRLPSTAIAAALVEDETGDLAGTLYDAGIAYRLEVADLPRGKAAERDALIAAAIPNRTTGRRPGTTRVEVTYRVPNIGDTPSYVDTVELDVLGVTARVIGFGGGILIGDAGELPIRAIPLSTIDAIEPIHPAARVIGFGGEVASHRACGQHDRPLPCLECE